MEHSNEPSVVESPPEVKKTKKVIDQTKLERYMASLRKEQNLSMAIIGGIVACLVGALL